MSIARTAPQRGHYRIAKRLALALDALCDGASHEEAAARSGMSFSGLRAALRRGNVQAVLADRVNKEMLLASLAVPATLAAVLRGGNDAARVAASKTLIEHGRENPLVKINVGSGLCGGWSMDGSFEGNPSATGPGYLIDLRQGSAAADGDPGDQSSDPLPPMFKE